MNTVKADEICKLCNLVFINEKMCKKHTKGDFHSRVQQVILSTPSQSSFILPHSVSIPLHTLPLPSHYLNQSWILSAITKSFGRMHLHRRNGSVTCICKDPNHVSALVHLKNGWGYNAHS